MRISVFGTASASAPAACNVTNVTSGQVRQEVQGHGDFEPVNAVCPSMAQSLSGPALHGFIAALARDDYPAQLAA